MVESHLQAGRQDLAPGRPLVYGQSITDPCLGWEDSAATGRIPGRPGTPPAPRSAPATYVLRSAMRTLLSSRTSWASAFPCAGEALIVGDGNAVGGLGFAEAATRRLGSPAPCNPTPEKQEMGPRPRFVAHRGRCLILVRGERRRGGGIGDSAARPRQNVALSGSCLSKNKSSPIPGGSRRARRTLRGSCPCCRNSEAFHVHDCRPRTFRLIVEGCVKILRPVSGGGSADQRGRRFTDYPRLPCRTNAL